MYYTKNNDPNYFFEHQEAGNCGSYALNVKEWYISDRDFDNTDIAYSMLGHGEHIDEVLDYITSLNVSQILEDFGKEIRTVINKEDVTDKEELIAFRIGIFNDEDYEGEIDTDFHFRVKRNGVWSEKCGSTEVKYCELQEFENWENNSGEVYNGPVVFFAKRI